MPRKPEHLYYEVVPFQMLCHVRCNASYHINAMLYVFFQNSLCVIMCWCYVSMSVQPRWMQTQTCYIEGAPIALAFTCMHNKQTKSRSQPPSCMYIYSNVSMHRCFNWYMQPHHIHIMLQWRKKLKASLELQQEFRWINHYAHAITQTTQTLFCRSKEKEIIFE